MKKAKVILSLMVALSLGVFSPMGNNNQVEAASFSSNIINSGKKLVGVPYSWGGTTPKGFDCSGFLGYVFKKNGKTLPRTVSQISTKGKSISKSKLKPGDVVLFTTYKKGPSHAGIYIGNNKFIHSSSSKGVTVTSLNSSYWKTKYIGAKRI